MCLVIWDKINVNNKILQGKIRNTIGKVENITIFCIYNFVYKIYKCTNSKAPEYMGKGKDVEREYYSIVFQCFNIP